ncbi:MAG: DNA polymerase I [Deltaproteobacteria bacterium]|nr:MAG: DNA polymerase I [Deltaproteobacteria bacterium]
MEKEKKLDLKEVTAGLDNAVFIVDGHSMIHRNYHAIRGLSTTKGFPTNAIFGFIKTLQKLLHDYRIKHLLIAFDAKGPTFRHKVFEKYKAQRPPMPDDLRVQIPVIFEIVDALGIPSLQVEGYEADDIIGTASELLTERGQRVFIVTMDKDMLQLVNDAVWVFDPKNEILRDPEAVEQRMGVTPRQVVDLLALMGDKVDNVPGVPGIGQKTAQKLIRQFGSLDVLYEHLDTVTPPRIRNLLETHRDAAYLSRDLVLIRRDVPLHIDEDVFVIGEPDEKRLQKIYLELEFFSMLKGLKQKKTLDSVRHEDYETVTSETALKKWLAGIEKKKTFSVDLETTSEDPLHAEIVGISLALTPGEACYIPVRHETTTPATQLAREALLKHLRPYLENPTYGKVGQNLKYDTRVLMNYGIHLQGIVCDAMVADYLLNPTKRTHNLDNMSIEYLGHQPISFKEVTGKAGAKDGFWQVPVAEATRYAAEDADLALRLCDYLSPKVREQGMGNLYESIELPLISVLAEMEHHGVKVDLNHLRDLSKELEIKMTRLEEKIHRLAGEPFNINSPKQLSVILFDKLGLKSIKKTKTGRSTNVDVLTALSLEHELPALVLEYRSFSKLKSGFVDALPKLVDAQTGRIHTSFNQTVASTGRLSSSNPNLQNIPIRTEEGRRIREAFIAEEGNLILSADYSQIELRILAHLSEDPILIQAFLNDEDVHARTASEVFGVPLNEVTPELRRRAKVINFGIIYGMSGFGLARELGIAREEAEAYIDQYFTRLKRVKQYQEELIDRAREEGLVRTIFGRIRPLPELKSKNYQQREFGIRTAINAPIQGSAADIIKKAMIAIQGRLKSEGIAATMVLQVHDELVFEVKKNEIPLLEPLVRQEMEHAVELRVPLKVGIQTGENWREAH